MNEVGSGGWGRSSGSICGHAMQRIVWAWISLQSPPKYPAIGPRMCCFSGSEGRNDRSASIRQPATWMSGQTSRHSVYVTNIRALRHQDPAVIVSNPPYRIKVTGRGSVPHLLEPRARKKQPPWLTLNQ